MYTGSVRVMGGNSHIIDEAYMINSKYDPNVIVSHFDFYLNIRRKCTFFFNLRKFNQPTSFFIVNILYNHRITEEVNNRVYQCEKYQIIDDSGHIVDYKWLKPWKVQLEMKPINPGMPFNIKFVYVSYKDCYLKIKEILKMRCAEM